VTDERDIRDPALDAAWRTQSAEVPPPSLDATILAAAHRAVKSAPEKIGPGAEATRPWRWWSPLAAAAAIGAIAIGALQLLPKEQDAAKVVVSDVPSGAQPAPAAKTESQALPPAAAPLAAAPSSPRATGEMRAAPAPPRQAPAPASPQSRDSAPREAKPAAPPAPEPFPARREAKVAADALAAPERSRARENAEATAHAESGGAAASSADVAARAQSSAAGAPAAAPAVAKRAMRDDKVTSRTSDDWIARIRTLLTEGKADEARRELAAFRAAYTDADTRLPADLQAWAATIPRN